MFVLLLKFIHVVYSAKILGFFTTPVFSHQQPFRALCKELALRGHDVTFISPHTINDESLPKIKEIVIQSTYDVWNSFGIERYLSKDIFNIELVLGYLKLNRIAPTIAYDVQEVHELLKSAETFDVLIIQAIHPLVFAIAAKFKSPIIGKFFFIFLNKD